MRKILMLALAITLVAGIAAAGPEHDHSAKAAWFDMENCGMCMPLAENTEMLYALGWDHHKTATGAVIVTTVPAQFSDDYAACSAKMEAAGAKLMGGAEMSLCGMCSSFMGIMGTGKVAMERFDTPNGNIMVVSSTDTDAIAKIHAHTDKTLAAMAEMAAQSEGSR